MGERVAVQRTPMGDLPMASGGNALAERSMPVSARDANGVGFVLKFPVEYSARTPGLPSVVSHPAGIGRPSLRRNCVPGTKVIFAVGNSAFRPSSTETEWVGM